MLDFEYTHMHFLILLLNLETSVGSKNASEPLPHGIQSEWLLRVSLSPTQTWQTSEIRQHVQEAVCGFI